MDTIETLWHYYDNWISWGTPGSRRNALRVKTQALIKMDNL